MTIECAILGMLSEESLTGYDVKKRIQASPLLPWSGNNNQVYKALSALLDDGYVTGEVHHQSGLPSKKIYTIAGRGRAALKDWLLDPPEPMTLGKPLLGQLRWMGMLGAGNVDALLEEYARQLRGQLGAHKPEQGVMDNLDATLRSLVGENIRMSYQLELDWANRARQAIAGYVERERGAADAERENEVSNMDYEVIEKHGAAYLHYRARAARPEAMEANQIVADCMGVRTNLVMIDEGALPEAFYRLATGVAGEVLQKLGQYHVKAALVMDAGDAKGKFREMLIEANRGSMFRSFESAEQAETWLLEGEAK